MSPFPLLLWHKSIKCILHLLSLGYYSPYSVEESRSDLLGDFQNLDEVTVRYSICKSGHDDNGDGDGDSDGDGDGDGGGDNDGDDGLDPVKLFSSCIFDLMK